MISAARYFTTHCPSCSTGFPIDPGKVPEGGIAAICSECQRVFTVVLPESFAPPRSTAAPAPPPAEEADAPAFTIEDEPPDSHAAPFELEIEETGREAPSPEAEVSTEVHEVTAADEPPPTLEEDAEPAQETDRWKDRMDAEPHPEAALLLGDDLPAPPVEEAPPTEPEPPAAPPPSPGSPSDPTFVDLSHFTEDTLADEAPSPPRAAGSPAAGKERFGKRDPHERAQHLARVLVSDIIAYYPVRYQEALSRGTLAEDFENEIQKSFREFVDQVGAEMAESTPYFNQALNEVLARGKQVF